MSLTLIILLAAACLVMMLAETRGLRTTLHLSFKGDIKRETQFLAQYGQFVCSIIVAWLVARQDARALVAAAPIVVSLSVTAVLCMVIKRLLGRVRPGRPQAGQFLGPSLRHASHRESFPSSHSASAVSLSVVLSSLYPAITIELWALALICAGLRYVMDAHWPSDVLGGILVGYVVAHLTLQYMPSSF
jgi:membrane-associated phospholipid phosphatase